MIDDLEELDRSNGLCHLMSGFGFKHISKGKKNRELFDIEIDQVRLRWNTKRTDWIDSVSGLEEVGSIHTVQGYDLNYAGVIFVPEISFDNATHTFRFHKTNYFDSARHNNHMMGEIYDDSYHLDLVLNIYRVLLSRGIYGTFIYCVDEGVQKFLGKVFGIENPR